MNETLNRAYRSACEATLATWELHSGIGATQDPPFHPTRLALTSGNRLPPTDTVLELTAGLRKVVGNDPLADLAGPANLHATFLAISWQLYDAFSDLPDLSELKACFARHCAGTSTSLQGLRLIALPNALLLAGYPDAASLKRRRAFADCLLASSWSQLLRARFPKGPIPPLFWHCTLLRYHAESLPDRLRRFFVAQQETRFGEVLLPIQLFTANYNWKTVFRLDQPPGASSD